MFYSSNELRRTRIHFRLERNSGERQLRRFLEPEKSQRGRSRQAQSEPLLSERLRVYRRLEAACRRALTRGACSYKSIESILKKGLDRHPLPEQPAATPASRHANIRGPQYYQKDQGER